MSDYPAFGMPQRDAFAMPQRDANAKDYSQGEQKMNNSPAQQLMYSRESPLDPRTWDLSDRYLSQSGVSGKNTPTPDCAGTLNGTPPTMPHQVT